ncbi:MAG: tRNA (adenosine(37)-N6)-threonylcarbamoyltransferase complex dimerization subunit type 1 TsaB [Nitrospiraceae bacterium]|nr:tRNA (adenosine(37)-N6)-threonylcarbamoyltransferase complex dimerization subunit type 1 TsaB [Nitrospiraceae bacterium]OQW67376.1 MAG: tRNA (adenosine(37)-N6)-threonylcarbamoyltransferase complex dimerization subunit type 1 TsaB [Nitrospira sp. ST-bin5]
MKVLAVETATSWQSVALLDDDRVLAQEDQEATGAHGTLLLPTITRLLAKSGLMLTQLDGLVCSIGPGSFTGLRVGTATLLGLRAATDLPLVLVPTLEAMAWSLRGTSGLICPVLPSRKDEIYWAVFRWGADRLERLVSEHVGSPQALAQTLTGGTTIFGEGWTLMEPAIRAALGPDVTIIPASGDPVRPSAVTVGQAGIERLLRGEIAGDHVAPLYVQRTEAEIRYEQSGGVSPVARRQARVATKTAARAARQPRSTGKTRG